MDKYACSKTDCTVAVTGKCLLSHIPVDGCPNLMVDGIATLPQESEEQPGSVVPTTRVYHGDELGLQQTSAMLAARYGHLIGILGAYGTGKTCLLSSLYLLASCGDLRPAYLFAGSATLPGFESRLRLLRDWHETAALPDQIVDHTHLPDHRQPGLLHLALAQMTSTSIRRDLFFTDLPGEWTTDLIKRAEVSERFQFLRRADGLVITLPAPNLLAPETRNSQIQSARILLQRLRDAVGVKLNIPVIFAITRCDKTGPVVPPAIYQLVEFATELGFLNISHMPVAAFSDRPDVPSGMGVASLLDALLLSVPAPQSPAPSHARAHDLRMFSRFRAAEATA